MSRTNCVNCGAAKDTDEIKCPFCGTTYLDFTAIDFGSGQPVVCQFLLPKDFHAGYRNSNDRVRMSMLAMPTLDEICIHTSQLDITSFRDSYKRYIDATPEVSVDIHFTPVTRRDGSMFEISQEKVE